MTSSAEVLCWNWTAGPDETMPVTCEDQSTTGAPNIESMSPKVHGETPGHHRQASLTSQCPSRPSFWPTKTLFRLC